jgi:urease accessory protein
MNATPSLLTQRSALIWLLALTVSSAAQAHTGDHATTFVAGLLHPLSGMDHLAAFLTVGMWSALGARRWWLAPMVFVGALCTAALAAPNAGSSVATEPMIAASLLVLGLLLATSIRLNPVVSLVLIAGFGWFHGAAHGTELAGSLSLWGVVVASVALHALGLSLGLAMRERSRWLPRSIGAAIALMGLATGWTLLGA